MGQKKILVLVGPSGSGKTTIGTQLSLKGYQKLVTTTTRAPRPGEKEGVDYFFKRPEELQLEDFIEQTIYNGNIYGLTRAEVKNKLNQSDIVHVAMDQRGAEAIKLAFPEIACIIYIQISLEQLAKRMRERGESEPFIQERLIHCQETGELDPPAVADVIIENNNLAIAVEEIVKIAEN